MYGNLQKVLFKGRVRGVYNIKNKTKQKSKHKMMKALTIAMIAIGCQALSLSSTNTSGQPEITCGGGATLTEDWTCDCGDEDRKYDEVNKKCVCKDGKISWWGQCI